MKLFAILAVVLASWISSRWGGERRRIRRALRDAPRELIAAAGTTPGAATPVRMTGRVVLIEPLIAPFSRRTCAYYEILVEETPSSEQRWIPRIQETAGTPFLLRDGTGDALVDPRGARVSTVPLVTKSGTFDDADDRERAFLASRKFAHRGTIFNKALRYTEVIIAPDALIAVLGTPVRDADPDGAARVGGYRDLPPTRAHLSGTREAPLLISDHPDAVAGSAAPLDAAAPRGRTSA